MDKKEFYYEVAKRIREQLGDQYIVSLQMDQEDHADMKAELEIRQGAEPMLLRFLLHEIYERYPDGIDTFYMHSIIADIVMRIQLRPKVKMIRGELARILDDYEKVKPCLAFRLVRAESYTKSLEMIPHRSLFNMAIVFYVYLKHEGKMANLLVTKRMLKDWGISADELYEHALSNMVKKMPMQVRKTDESTFAVFGRTSYMLAIPVDDAEHWDPDCVYVVTNNKHVLGASAMLYPDFLKRYAEKAGKNLLIIPSSVSEVFFVEDTDMARQRWERYLRESNEACMDFSEMLSNQLYCYNRKTQEIEPVPPQNVR